MDENDTKTTTQISLHIFQLFILSHNWEENAFRFMTKIREKVKNNCDIQIFYVSMFEIATTIELQYTI